MLNDLTDVAPDDAAPGRPLRMPSEPYDYWELLADNQLPAPPAVHVGSTERPT